MGLDPAALVTVAEARTHLGDPTISEGGLEQAINGKSLSIARWCRREFVPQVQESRTFAYYGAGVLNLAPYDLRGSPTVELDGEPVDAESFTFYPRGGSTLGTFLWVALPSRCAGRPGSSTEIVIDGDWGVWESHTDVAGDLKLACLREVAREWRNPEGFAARALGELDVALGPADDSGLALSTRQDLAAYARKVIL